MRYNLGYVDKYPIEATGSNIENSPMYRVTFKRPIDPVRLEAAARSALTAFPLFATQVEFDREYYLRSNDRPLVILKATEETRPKVFGKNTNGYPWRIVYDGCELCFEWLHGVTDGMGALCFLKQVLLCYFGFNPEVRSLNFLVAPGLEPFIDPKEKGIRRILNFGHTVGHGVEAVNEGRLLHGEAVAVGMLFAAGDELKAKLLHIYRRLDLDEIIGKYYSGIPDNEKAAVLSAMSHDKKANGEYVSFIVSDKIGSCEIVKKKLSEII